jgi:O-antigen/teichoic acid export membrane protein
MSTNLNENNKRIAKNTLMLYIRMMFTMGVSLYTSRVVLNRLGVEDYGIYSVVGGIISMISFINGGLISAIQRYITFEIGQNNIEKLKKVFTTSIQIILLISFIIVLFGETVGLWFLNEKMVIPENRQNAAFLVFQCSIITCIINFLSIPYNADIIAHERMSAFAYISIVEVILKLVIVFLLNVFEGDKLIIYAILVLSVQIFIRFLYANYCRRKFTEARYRHSFDKGLFKDMISFTGWSFWGGLATVLSTNGLDIMLNVFFGPIVNAARGISVQVRSAIQSFVTNFQTAINPQITKNYAMGNISQMHNLMFKSARLSFFLLFLLALPIILETNFILELWLETVPHNTVIFTQIMLIISLMFTVVNPCVIANQATGKVKIYQILVGGTLLLIVPISYIVLELGAPAYSVFLVQLCVEIIAQLERMLILRKQINLPLISYFNLLYKPIIVVVIPSVILPLIIRALLDEGWLRFSLVCSVCIISVSISILKFGLNKNERDFITTKLLNIFKIKK